MCRRSMNCTQSRILRRAVVGRRRLTARRLLFSALCATVHVCVQPTDRRTRSVKVTPAERALACHSAPSASLARNLFTHTARPALVGHRFRFGGHRGHGPPPASAGDARSVAPRSTRITRGPNHGKQSRKFNQDCAIRPSRYWCISESGVQEYPEDRLIMAGLPRSSKEARNGSSTCSNELREWATALEPAPTRSPPIATGSGTPSLTHDSPDTAPHHSAPGPCAPSASPRPSAVSGWSRRSGRSAPPSPHRLKPACRLRTATETQQPTEPTAQRASGPEGIDWPLLHGRRP